MKAAVPADQQRPQRGMSDNFAPDQQAAKFIPPILVSKIATGIHQHAKNIYPGKDWRIKPEKKHKERNINGSGDNAAALCDPPELGAFGMMYCVHAKVSNVPNKCC